MMGWSLKNGNNRRNEEEIYKKKLNEFKGYYCKQMQIHINSNADFVDCCTFKSLNTLFPEKQIGYKKCVTDKCTCSHFLKFHKRINN